MIKQAVFTAPHTVDFVDLPEPALGPGQVRIRTLFSGISRGTERLVFEGNIGQSEWERMRCPMQDGTFPFPVKYGYCATGVIEDGPADLVGRVFVARDLDGVRSIRASATLPGFKVSDQPVIASDRVRYVGEIVALCIGNLLFLDLAGGIGDIHGPVDQRSDSGPGPAARHRDADLRVFRLVPFRPGERQIDDCIGAFVLNICNRRIRRALF